MSLARIGLAFDGTSLFFINGYGSDTLWELDPDTGAVIDSDLIPAGSGHYDGLAALGGPSTFSTSAPLDIIEFDPVTDTVTNTLDVDGVNGDWIGGGLAAIANPDALVVTGASGEVYEINPATGVITHQFPEGFAGAGLAVVEGEIYVGSSDGSLSIDVYLRDGTLLDTLFSLPYDVSALAGHDLSGPAFPLGEQAVTLLAGDTERGVDFGNQYVGTPVEIHGTKWNDLNGNGVRDDGRARAAGWTIYLDYNNNGTLDPTSPRR